jgi:hypothetical protein
MLIKGMTPQEIRVLQEYRRLTTETMDVDAIKTIRHPVGGGEAPGWSLVDKGFLASDAERKRLTLTGKGREFLAIDARPLYEQGSSAEETTEE